MTQTLAEKYKISYELSHVTPKEKQRIEGNDITDLLLLQNVFSFGRDGIDLENTLKSPYVSRSHASIQMDETGLKYIENGDNGSYIIAHPGTEKEWHIDTGCLMGPGKRGGPEVMLLGSNYNKESAHFRIGFGKTFDRRDNKRGYEYVLNLYLNRQD